MGDSFTGLTINEMTTFGFIMALGIVVDDAVVVGESVYTTRRQDGDTVANTIRGTMKVAVPTLFGVLTTVAAFMSLSNVTGDLGQIYAQFGTVVTICLLLSVVESKLILPSHLAHINTHRQIPQGIKGWWARIQHGADSGLMWFNRCIYCPVIEKALNFRYAVILAFVALMVLVVGMPMTGSVRVAFFPDIPGDVVTADLSMQNDASFGQTNSNLLMLERTALQADKNLFAGKTVDSNEVTMTAIKSLQIIAEDDSSGKLQVELVPNALYTSTEFEQEWERLSGSPEGVKKN